MKKVQILFIIVLLLITNALNIFCQTKQDLIINTLMQQGRWFDVRDYFSLNKDSISEIYYLAAKSSLYTYFNKPDSANMNIEILLNSHKLEDNSSFNFAILMMKNFIETQRYNEAIGLINDILTHFGNVLPKSHKEALNSWVSICNLYKNNPYKVKYKYNENNLLITIFELPLVGIGVDCKINGVKEKTLLDTGTSLNRISKEVADQIGIHTYLPDTIITTPGVKVLKGIIDSVEIGNVKIYNCPVDITLGKPDFALNSEKKKRLFSFIDSVYNNYNFILGISTMKLFGIINFDFLNRTISFEQNAKEKQQPSNMFIIDNLLYLNTTLNNQPFTSMFDTGYSSGTFLNKEYYNKYKEYYNLKDDQQQEMHTYMQDRLDTLIYEKLNNVLLKSYNNSFTLKNVMVNLSKPFEYSSGYPVPDGIIGNDFLKMLKFMRLDFTNMCITFE